MKNTYFLFILASLSLFACHRKKAADLSSNTLPTPMSSYFSDEDKLIFLGVKLKGDDNYIANSAELSGKKVVVGRMKTENENLSAEPGTIRIVLADGSGNPLGATVFANPLVRKAEFTGTDGILQTREVKAKEIESTYRIAYIPGAVQFELQVNQSKDKTLTLLKGKLLD